MAKPPAYITAFGGERDNSRQKSRFRERKVARKPGMLPQTNLLTVNACAVHESLYIYIVREMMDNCKAIGVLLISLTCLLNVETT